MFLGRFREDEKYKQQSLSDDIKTIDKMYKEKDI